VIAKSFVVIALVALAMGGQEISAAPAAKPGEAVKFEDVTATAGITFQHERAQFHPRLAKIMPWLTAGGSGVAIGDYDKDGFDDIYFTTSALGKPNHLYRNEGNFRFREVATEVGLARVNDSRERGTSSFALWLDYDNDGWQDLFLLRFGITELFHNEHGKFVEVTDRAGVRRRTNALSATAFDFDRDGDVDIFIGGYFPEKDFFDPPDTRVLFESWETARNGARKYLFRNDGAGKFAEVANEAGFQDAGWAMAVGHGDINNDGWHDIYIANDFGPDTVLKNDKGHFVDITSKAIGVDTKKGMNADFGDFDNDGQIDVYITNMTEPYLSECNMLWRNNGDETFSDVSMEMHACDTRWGWGAKFIDVNNDGLLDIYAANGFISAGNRDYMETLLDFVLGDEGDITDASRWPAMSDSSMAGYERNVLLLQTSHGFVPVSEQAGVDSILDGRGVAIADFDRDGRMDMVVSNVSARPNIYRNVSAASQHWIEFRLTGKGKASNRSAIGSRISVRSSDRQQMREIASANGFDAQSSLQAHFGLGAERTAQVTVKWSDGTEQKIANLSADAVYEWTQGELPRAMGDATRADGNEPKSNAMPMAAVALASAETALQVAQVAPVGQPTASKAPATVSVKATAVEFREVSREAGIAARHHPPEFDSAVKHIMPMLAAGAAGGAIGDYNNDGQLDVFVNDPHSGRPSHLYRNSGNMTFTDVAESAGVAKLSDDMEVASGGLFFDYDGDGWDDLLVLRFGKPLMFHNRRDGTFKDVSKRAGFDQYVNALSAVAFDFDRDGDLDLYLGAYFQDVNMFKLERQNVLHDSWETSRNGGRNLFYRNNGDGTFSEITAAAGLEDTGWTMAVGHGDFDSDGWQDLYVANDFGPDRVFRNTGKGRFEDITERATGIDTKKGMNAEVADFDNDGDLDLYVTNVTEGFLHECNMLWQNNGRGEFTDVSQEMNTCDTGWGWAGKFFDYDNDMDLDLYVANGFFTGGGKGDYLDDLLPALWDSGEDPSNIRAWPPINGKSIASRERNVFFVNSDGKHFSRIEGNGLDVAKDSRAILLADFNTDGRVDLFVTNNDDQAQLFLNEKMTTNHWLEVDLEGKAPNTKAIGARVFVQAGSTTQMREVSAGNGFGGGSMVRQQFGLGPHKTVDRIRVRWPDGSEESVAQVPVNRLIRLRQGAGRVEPAAKP